MRARAGAVVVAVVLAVGGCSPEPAPVPTATSAAEPNPRSTASPSASPPAPPAPPTLPAAADDPTADGAVAAALHFLELDRYAFLTGDAEALAAMSATSCVYCEEVLAEVADASRTGTRTWRDENQILSTSVVEVRPAEFFNVDIRLRQGAAEVLGDDGTVVASRPVGPPVDVKLALSRVDDRWVVDAGMVQVVES